MGIRVRSFCLATLVTTACGGPEALPTDTGGAAPPVSCADPGADCREFTQTRPSRLSEHATGYSSKRRELYVFGGTSTIPKQCEFPRAESRADLHIYSERCAGWRQVPASGPEARTRSAGSFGDGRFWIFGGRTLGPGAEAAYEVMDDLWAYDPETERWTEAPNRGPDARSDAALAWDPNRNVLWMFGGNRSSNGAVYEPTRDVWSYDTARQAWTEHAPAGPGPSARLQHAMLLDPERDRLVVFGGSDESAFTGRAESDRTLWALDLETLSWERLATEGPQGRFWGSIAYAASSDSYWLFGGHDDQQLGNRNDLWRFAPDSAQWQEVTRGDTFNRQATEFCAPPYDFATVDVESPERRSSQSFAWSDACEHGLLFAGKTDCGATDDLWVFDESGWAPVLQATVGEVCWRAEGSPDSCLGLCL